MRVIVGIALYLVMSVASAQAPTIGVFLPADTPFWNKVGLFAQAAGQSLGADIRLFHSDLNRLRLMQQIEQAASDSAEPFDALVFPNFLHSAASMIQSCERHQVVCVLFNSDLNAAERNLLGRPAERYRFWVGHMIPDDVSTSAAMTQVLLDAARAGDTQRPLAVVGVNGYQSDPPAIARERGLRQQLRNQPDLKLQQVVYTDWSGADAATRMRRLLVRYPRTNVVWSANYRTTTGILSALKAEGREPGTDVFVNSFGITPEALNQLDDGDIEVTAGGHYVEGAWSVVMAYDALQGHIPRQTVRTLQTPQLVVTRQNLNDVRLAIERLASEPERLFNIDFRQFSLAADPGATGYQFSFRPILEELLTEPASQRPLP